MPFFQLCLALVVDIGRLRKAVEWVVRVYCMLTDVHGESVVLWVAATSLLLSITKLIWVVLYVEGCGMSNAVCPVDV